MWLHLRVRLRVPDSRRVDYDLAVYRQTGGPSGGLTRQAISNHGAGVDEVVTISGANSGIFWVQIYPSDLVAQYEEPYWLTWELP